ncbi:hypothetical protein EsH8_VII_000135 [Colletotrichum jinshuiense]
MERSSWMLCSALCSVLRDWDPEDHGRLYKQCIDTLGNLLYNEAGSSTSDLKYSARLQPVDESAIASFGNSSLNTYARVEKQKTGFVSDNISLPRSYRRPTWSRFDDIPKTSLEYASLRRRINHSVNAKYEGREGTVDVTDEVYLPFILSARSTRRFQRILESLLPSLHPRNAVDSVWMRQDILRIIPRTSHLPEKDSLSEALVCIIASLPMLESETFHKAIVWITHAFQKAVAENNEATVFRPHNLALLANAALHVDPRSECYYSIISLLYLCVPDIFSIPQNSEGVPPEERIFDVCSAVSVADFLTSNAGSSLLQQSVNSHPFQFIFSGHLQGFDAALVKPLIDICCILFDRGLDDLVPYKNLEAYVRGIVQGLPAAGVETIASILNFCLIEHCETELVDEVLANVKFEMVDQSGRTLLHESAKRGLTRLIDFLTAAGNLQLIDVKDCNGSTPLHEAAMRSSSDTAKSLLIAGAKVDVQDNEGRTPLHMAAMGGSSSAALDVLLEAGGNPNIQDKKGRTILHLAVADASSPAILSALLGAGAEPDIQDNEGRTPLHLVGETASYLDTLIILVQHKADPNIRDQEGQTPLHELVKFNSSDAVQILLEAGARADVQDNEGRTPLHYVTAVSSSNTFNALLKAGANPNVRDNTGRTPLFSAARMYSSDAVKTLLDIAADVNVQDNEGVTPLHVAVATSSLEIVKALREAGARVDVRDNQGQTPLHRAAKKFSTDVLKVLLDDGADINVQDREGRTPLHDGVKAYFTNAVTALLDAGARADIKDNKGVTPLHEAAEIYHSTNVVEALLKAGAQPNEKDEEGQTSLHRAAKRYTSDTIKILLNAGARTDIQDSQGRTPLHKAAKRQLEKTVIALVKAGADVNIQDHEGRTALHEISMANRPDAIQALLDFGARVDVQDNRGRSPLHEAVTSYSSEIVRALIKAGAQINVPDSEGRTSLHEAAGSSPIAVEALLEAGADADMQDNRGRTPLHEAATTHSFPVSIVKTLLKARAQPNTRDIEGRTPLHEAAKSSPKAVKPLLDAGAQPYEADNQGQTPLHDAAKASSQEAFGALLDAGADPNARDNEGQTPLYLAVQTDAGSYGSLFLDIVTRCPQLKHEQEKVPSFTHTQAAIKTLLEHGADINIARNDGSTVFHVAAQAVSTGCLRLLLDRSDANADTQDSRGDTALHAAVKIGANLNSQLLAPRFTSFLTENNEGLTPVDIATARSRKALYLLIQEAKLSQISRPSKKQGHYFAHTSTTMLATLKRAILLSKIPLYHTPDGKKLLPRLQTFPLSRKSRGPPAAIRTQIRELLESEGTRGWAVSSLSLGVTQKDAVPAIVVIHPMAEKLCPQISSRIGDNVEYLIEEGAISKSSGIASEFQVFQEEPINGSSIGSNTLGSRWGSLGGYLKYSDGEIIAITCGHVLSRKSKPEAPFVCVQPSICHLKYPSNGSETRISMTPDPACLKGKLYQEGYARTHNHPIQDSLKTRCPGIVPVMCHCFGLAGPINGHGTLKMDARQVVISDGESSTPIKVTMSMDWAILTSLCRSAKQNMIHDRIIKSWKSVIYETNEEGEVLVGTDQKVYKQGASSGKTQGFVNSRLTDCWFGENPCVTQEIGVLGCDGDSFSGSGDSGSWVMEDDEEDNASVIGVLIGGYGDDGASCISLMTPMEHLLADISSTLGIQIDDDLPTLS